MNARIFAVAILAAVAAQSTLPSTQTTGAAATAQATNGTIYAFAPAHLRFTLPPNWTVIPQEKLDAYNAAAQALAGRRAAPQYLLGLQRKSLFIFDMPYVLIEVDPGTMPSQAQVDGEVQGFQQSIGLAYRDLHRAGKFGEVISQPALYYEDAHVIIGHYSMVRMEDRARIGAVTAIFPFRGGFVRFHCYMRFEKQEADMPVIEELIASVKFDENYGYAPTIVKRSVVKNPTAVVGGVAVLMVIYFIMRILAGRSRSR
jgi:hypothetical protein